MELIGAAAVIFLYWCVVHLGATGRWAYLALAFWTFPCIGAAFFVPKGTEINGLVVLICFIALITESMALSKVKMWNVNARRTSRVAIGIFYVISLIFVYYCAYESQRLGYIPNFQGAGQEAPIRKAIGTIIIMLMNIPATALMLYVIDRFFSNKSNFVIIRCDTFIAGTFGKFDEKILKNRYICGINNGKEYYFCLTNKAYILLKNMKTCRLRLKKGVLGGLYVTEYPADIDNNLAKNADKWLLKRSLSVTAVFAIVLLIVILA